MDKQNEEFEIFLRQFHLRSSTPPAELIAVERHHWTRWAAATAAILIVTVAAVLFRNIATSNGPYATVEVASASAYTMGQRVGSNDVIRSGSRDGVLLALDDTSKVEMRAQSELRLESAADGLRVRLNAGSIIVNAAKQQSSHLYVQTPDLNASAVGTVFLVKTTTVGSLVAVIEGEVQVQQGSTLKRLHPGEHLATIPSMAPESLVAEVEWSVNAAAHLPVRPQSVTAGPPAESPAQPKVGTTRSSKAVQRYYEKLASPVKKQGEPQSGPPQEAPPPQETPRQQEQQPPLPEGAGKEILERTCSTCHVADVVRTQHFPTKDDYAALIQRMNSMGGSVTPTEFPVLVDYLYDNFGNKPTEPRATPERPK